MKPIKVPMFGREEECMQLESTGRILRSYGNDDFGIGGSNYLYGGYDDTIMILDEDDNEEYSNGDFTPEEKQEIAMYMMQKWKDWANLEHSVIL